ncbi:MAG: insulinase family protein [Gammaproteobacteria bacterium]|nr:insulinase family protein [Gammaproteobacteria bacterium]
MRTAAALLLLAAATTHAKDVDIPFHREVLDNGLTLVVHEDRRTPMVEVSIWYHVGSKNEVRGRTGFAHLFEHLMFQGTENYRGEIMNALEDLGSPEFNGTTWLDRTNYYQTVPKNALDSVLWLESDRMGHFIGAVTQPVLDEQRGVVQNEKRQRQNQPYGKVYAQVQAGLFPPEHPYSWETIGSMEDLNAASLDDVRTWFETWYGPNNAVLVIAGDIDTKDVVARVKHYFGDIPARDTPARPEAWIPRLAATKRIAMTDRVPQPRLFMSWTSPPWGSEGAHHMAMAVAILAGNKNSRLYQRLVYRDQLATDVELDATAFEISGITSFEASPTPGVELAKMEAVVREEIERFARGGPTRREIERVRAEARAWFLRSIERIGGNSGKAATLAESEVYGGRPDAWKDEMAAIESASADDLKRIVAEWLTGPALVVEVQPAQESKVAATGADRTGGLPRPGPAPSVGFPAVESRTLGNGLKLLLSPRPGSGLVELRLVVEGGYATDPMPLMGVANVTLAMMDEGTTSRDALEISDELALLGANLGTGAQLDTSSISLSVPGTALPGALEIMADIARNPSFPQSELDRLRGLFEAALKQEKTRPTSMGLRVLPQLLFGRGHAYARPLTGTGTEATLAAIRREHIVEFHRTWFRPNCATIVAAGDTTLAELGPLVERAFGGWQPGEATPPVIGPPRPAAGNTLYLLDRPGAEQSVIFAGQTLPGRDSPGDFALQFLNNAFGGQFSSRLNMNLREDKHWSYGAFSIVADTRGARPFFAYAPVQTDRTAESLAEVRREFADILAARPVGDEEFARIQRNEVLALTGRWETNAAVVGSLAESVRFRLADDYWQRYGERLAAVTAEDVRSVVGSELKPDDLVYVIIGDRSKIEPGLKAAGFGDIRAIDADGEIR